MRSISVHSGAGERLARERERQLVAPQHEVEQVRGDLGVGAKRALVAELLEVAAVDAVARDLAVVHDRPVEQRERVRAAPPARRVRREPVVADPGVALVLLEEVEVPDLLGEADALERAHVLARRGDERAVDAAS